MEEIQHYDKAAHKFYNGQRFNALPITTWDLFAEQFRITGEGLSDIVKFTKLAEGNKWDATIPFKQEILDKNHIVVVTDASLNIVHASQNIHQMNGYTSEELIGKKPKMFQGELTCQETSRKIGKAVRERIPFEATILNYRKDGSTYNCWIKGMPIKDITGKVVNFIAFEKEVA
ncbi:PAS domain-containing protein [uncultured Croceitalea sp.]|uniref:PAS domain-containing protein n=1 Tax=uncultured Croceitalea sp. TaxID=1798908 RepID=UPI00374ED0D5